METLNLQPPTIEWKLYRNDTSPLTVLLTDSEGRDLDLTDWDFEAEVREYPTDSEVIQAFSLVKNGNVLTLELDNTNLPLLSYFDIQGTNTVNSKVSTVLRGQIIVEEDVTR
jgi:hypothetical protein